jgi:uncharacterized protein
MALRGFVALTFDPSFNGYSGGEPRHLSSPDIFVEDFSAAVDYLGTRPFVDRERIGVIGMCGSGALSLSAAQVDRRIKAVAPVVMYDHHRLYAEGFENSLTEAQRIAFQRRAPGAALRGLRGRRAAPDPARRADRIRREH